MWLLLAGAAQATSTLGLGPAMTNPYLRHPFQTVAALATLQEVAGERVFLGLAAGGSEASIAADVDRRDAAVRTAALVELVLTVVAGGPLDDRSGRNLEVPLARPTILVAGGRNQMLQVAGSHADQALVWSTALSDLERVTGTIRRGAAARQDGGPEVVWAPLVELPGEPDGEPGNDLASVAVYAVLNAGSATLGRWGLGAEEVGDDPRCDGRWQRRRGPAPGAGRRARGPGAQRRRGPAVRRRGAGSRHRRPLHRRARLRRGHRRRPHRVGRGRSRRRWACPDHDATVHVMPDTPDTVTEAVALLEAEGYRDPMQLRAEGLVCSVCGAVTPPTDLDHVKVDRIFRFEGESDPDDEMIVLAVSCSTCQARGVIVAAYGVDVDSEQAEALRHLAAGR